MKVRIIDENGTLESECSVDEFRAANAESECAIETLESALDVYARLGDTRRIAPGVMPVLGPQTCAHAWGGGGAAAAVYGLVLIGDA